MQRAGIESGQIIAEEFLNILPVFADRVCLRDRKKSFKIFLIPPGTVSLYSEALILTRTICGLFHGYHVTGAFLSSTQDMISVINEKGTDVEGIFRVPVSLLRPVRALREKLDSGEEVNFKSESPLFVASVLKVGKFQHHPHTASETACSS